MHQKNNLGISNNNYNPQNIQNNIQNSQNSQNSQNLQNNQQTSQTSFQINPPPFIQSKLLPYAQLPPPNTAVGGASTTTAAVGAVTHTMHKNSPMFSNLIPTSYKPRNLSLPPSQLPPPSSPWYSSNMPPNPSLLPSYVHGKPPSLNYPYPMLQFHRETMNIETPYQTKNMTNIPKIMSHNPNGNNNKSNENIIVIDESRDNDNNKYPTLNANVNTQSMMVDNNNNNNNNNRSKNNDQRQQQQSLHPQSQQTQSKLQPQPQSQQYFDTHSVTSTNSHPNPNTNTKKRSLQTIFSDNDKNNTTCEDIIIPDKNKNKNRQTSNQLQPPLSRVLPPPTTTVPTTAATTAIVPTATQTAVNIAQQDESQPPKKKVKTEKHVSFCQFLTMEDKLIKCDKKMKEYLRKYSQTNDGTFIPTFNKHELPILLLKNQRSKYMIVTVTKNMGFFFRFFCWLCLLAL